MTESNSFKYCKEWECFTSRKMNGKCLIIVQIFIKINL